MSELEVMAATLRNGGGTFRVDIGGDIQQVFPSMGYAVGLAEGNAVVINAKGVTGLPTKLLSAAIRWVAAAYGVERVGTWIDGDRIYVDPVVVILSEIEAQYVGRALKQKSIYDFTNREVITL